MPVRRMPPRIDAELPAGLPVGSGWKAPDRTAPMVDAWTREHLRDVPEGTAALADEAMEHAEGLRAAARRTTAAARKRLVGRCAAELRERSGELEDLLVLETGKPRRDCRVEVQRTLSCWEASAEEVGRNEGELVPVDLQPGGEDMLAWYRRRPLGTVVAIAGFNYPLLLASHKIAPALAVGTPSVLKPAPATALSALWLTAIVRGALREEGMAEGLLQCLTGGPDVGRALVEDPRAAVVSFTGSARVGHEIARSAAPRRTVLELGSNAALIVTGSADPAEAVDAVVRGAFYANGQACISVQRVLVLDDVDRGFEAGLAEALDGVVVGDPWDGATHVAALIDEGAAARVDASVAAACGRGARVLGRAPVPEAAASAAAARSLVAPQILVDVPVDDELWREEVFAPVACVRRVRDLDEAVRVANDSRYGLQASIYTADLAEAHQAVDELEVGGVVVNQIPGFRSDVMPYGGVKDSGVGREGPRWAMEEYTVTRMAMMRIPRKGGRA
ncbi:aldehyde dehydrogenase family protein [Nocardiopsis ganjiahuensis]|uniref:aldehyde dehydrogenase family protein n=1 Tax=Nocardiopsis ganjiahuensis TaxID=239984 RepID=UPI0019553933|nr:aldehyde dehydrogenase family protein [Nocardiopsis ganjiahuensis]